MMVSHQKPAPRPSLLAVVAAQAIHREHAEVRESARVTRGEVRLWLAGLGIRLEDQ